MWDYRRHIPSAISWLYRFVLNLVRRRFDLSYGTTGVDLSHPTISGLVRISRAVAHVHPFSSEGEQPNPNAQAGYRRLI